MYQAYSAIEIVTDAHVCRETLENGQQRPHQAFLLTENMHQGVRTVEVWAMQGLEEDKQTLRI